MLSGRVGPRDVRAVFGDPIVVGGTGGSGTRSIAQLLARGGVCMGSRHNDESDALAFVHFDWRHGRELLTPMTGSPAAVGSGAGMSGHDRAFRRAVRAHLQGWRPSPQQPMWGWKHPHSYLLLPYLRRQLPGLRFVQVVRDGRDMAFSDNQRQARQYGPVLLGGADAPIDPIRSAAYWSAANLYAAAGGAALGEAYHVIRLEDLCAEPAKVTFELLRFAGRLPAGATLGDLDWAEQIVHAPSSLGRWRSSGYDRIEELTAAAAPGLAHFGYL